MTIRKVVRAAACLAAVLISAWPAAAQVTTGTMVGKVVDQQGGAIPGATVVLVSESQGTKTAPVVTNETGDFQFPNIRPDIYTIEISMPAFKTLKRSGSDAQSRIARHAWRAHARGGRHHRGG